MCKLTKEQIARDAALKSARRFGLPEDVAKGWALYAIDRTKETISKTDKEYPDFKKD